MHLLISAAAGRPTGSRPAWQGKPWASRRGRRGLTVLELLVVSAIVGLLACLLLPAIGAVRESARRIQCVDRLREIGLALHQHHDARGTLPAGWQFDPSNRSAYGWVVPALPHLGQASLASQIQCSRPVSAKSHAQIRGTSLAMLLCPSDISERTFVLYKEDGRSDDDDPRPPTALAADNGPVALLELPTANYIGVFGTLEPDDRIPAPVGDGAFLENRGARFGDFQRGLSHTLLVGERTMARVPSTWFGVSLAGEDAAARLVGAALQGINHPLADECDFSSRHPGGANFLWGDGHVSLVSQAIGLSEYHQAARLRP